MNICKVVKVISIPGKGDRAIVEETGGAYKIAYVTKKSEPICAGDYVRVWSYAGAYGRPRDYCASL